MSILSQLKFIVILIVIGIIFNIAVNKSQLHDELKIIGKYYPSGKNTANYLTEKRREFFGIKMRGDKCNIQCPFGQYCKKIPDAYGNINEVCMP